MADKETDKMTIEEAYRALDLYKIKDEEKRGLIISAISKKPMYQIVEMTVQISRGKDIKWLKSELGIEEEENTVDER